MHTDEEIVLEAGRAERNYWRDVWTYRELFYFLAWRDILVRYKQTAFGVAWAVIRPLITTAVLTVVFRRVAGLQSTGDAPYALMVLAGMLPWQFFSSAMSDASNSLVLNANLISKVYFPRLVVPVGSVITNAADLVVMLPMMAGLMLWYGFVPDWRLLALPYFALLAAGGALGAGLALCALNVKYRDVRYVVPFIVQFGIYISPVGFGSENIPARWRLLYACNPMTGIIDGFRWALLRGGAGLWWPSVVMSTVGVLLLCIGGIYYFRRTERAFADII